MPLVCCTLFLACSTRTGGDDVTKEAGLESGAAGATNDAAPDADADSDALLCSEPGQPCDGVTAHCCDGLCAPDGTCPVYED